MNFTTGEAIKWGWNAFKENIGMLIVVFILTGIATSIPSGLQAVTNELDATALAIGFQFVGMFVNIFVAMIWIRVGLDIYDTGTFDFNRIFRVFEGNIIGNYLILSIIVGILVTLGFFLLIVPGIILALMWWLAPNLVVDRKLTFSEAMSESKRLTDGHKMELFGVLLLIALFSVSGILVFFVGLIITMPVAYLAFIYVYRQFVPAQGDGLEQVMDSQLPPPQPQQKQDDQYAPPQF